MNDRLDIDMIRSLIAAQLPGETCDALITVLSARLRPREKTAVRDSYLRDAYQSVPDKKDFLSLVKKAPRTHRPDEAGRLLFIASRFAKIPGSEKQFSRILEKDILAIEMSA